MVCASFHNLKEYVACFMPENKAFGEAVVLSRSGEVFFATLTPQEIQEEGTVFYNDYLFETFSQLIRQPLAHERLSHLSAPRTAEMALFFMQQYVTPILRELEIIEHGIWRAISTYTKNISCTIAEALELFFHRHFITLEKMQDALAAVSTKEAQKSEHALAHFTPFGTPNNNNA